MSEEEIKAIAQKLKAENKAEFDALQSKINDFEAGKVSKEDIATEVTKLQDAMEAKYGNQIETFKTQIANLAQQVKGGIQTGKEKTFEIQFKEDVQANKFAGKGSEVYYLSVSKTTGELICLDEAAYKAVDTHRVENPTVANRSLTSSMTLGQILRGGGANEGIFTIDRTTPWILSYVSLGQTVNGSYRYWDETPKEGDFALTDECAVKPQLLYKFEAKGPDVKKAAGWVAVSREFERDFPGLLSTIKRLLLVDCKNKMHQIVLADIVANATPYVNAQLVGQIDNADDWAAIGAMAAQVAGNYGSVNSIIMNHNRSLVSAASKATDGHYLNYQHIKDEINAGGISIMKSPDVAYNSVVVGDLTAYNVMELGAIRVEIGTINNQLITNERTIVVEQEFFSFIPTARKRALVTGDLNAIKALIEKP